MLVAGMTVEEVRREILRDVPEIYRKASYIATKLRKILKPAKDKVVYRVFEHLSAYHNKWVYSLKISRSGIEVFMLAWYYNHSGLHAYAIFDDSDYLMHFDSHFFKRYNERENLNLTKMTDVMKAYVQSNFFYSLHKRKKIHDRQKMFCIIDKGLILGDQDDRVKLVNARTFLPFRLLNRGQTKSVIEGARELVESLQRRYEPIITIPPPVSGWRPGTGFSYFRRTWL